MCSRKEPRRQEQLLPPMLCLVHQQAGKVVLLVASQPGLNTSLDCILVSIAVCSVFVIILCAGRIEPASFFRYVEHCSWATDFQGLLDL